MSLRSNAALATVQFVFSVVHVMTIRPQLTGIVYPLTFEVNTRRSPVS